MKKLYLFLGILAASLNGFSLNAQTILDENFNGVDVNYDDRYAALSIDGWTQIDKDASLEFPKRWCVYASGKRESVENRAWIDATDYTSTPKLGCDYLLTPLLDLDGTYQLSFQWSSSGMALDAKQYDFQVRVVEEGQDPADVDYIWSFLDPDMVLESGIAPTDYGWYSVPWVGWQKYVSKLDLSPWKGKKVKIAFVYKLMGTSKINSVELDDVKVEKVNLAETPVATPSVSEWKFGSVYVGSKTKSDMLKLTNTGVSGLTISSIECPDGFSVVTSAGSDLSSVSLKKNEYLQFQIVYSASMTSAGEGEIVFKTNGPDAKVAVSASKQMLPSGYTYEGFEGETFPPSGWHLSGGWIRMASPIEGDWAAVCSANMEQEAQELTTPRIDASSGAITFEYNFYDLSNDEEGSGCDNVVTVSFSKDGGSTWSVLDTFDYNNTYNENIHKSYTLTADKTAGSDNCYFKFSYLPLDYYDSEYGPVISYFYVDAVVLPPLYGAGGVPAASELVTPADKAVNLYPKEVELTWKPALFAEGYRLYVGTDASATDLINGVDLGEALSYSVPSLAYSTTYNWKVVPYNSKGDAVDVPVWSFTTQADQTVTSYPYSEAFEGDVFPPLGWITTAQDYSKWSRTSTDPYEGNYSATAMAGLAGSVTELRTQEFKLPADNPMMISFYWGDGPCVSLAIDETGTKVNTTDGSDGIADLDFEIYVDGAWHHLAKLSNKKDLYWLRERFDLSAYAGKTVMFRWVRTVFNFNKAGNASLDKISVEPVAKEKLSFNLDGWDAYKVNYGCSFSSGSVFTLFNDGSDEIEIASVQFSSPNFSSTLNAGDKVASGKGLAFGLTFDAGSTSAEVSDVMKVTTKGGSVAEFPVSGIALPSDVRFYGFEEDEYGSLQPQGFTTIDNDRRASIALAYVTYAHRGEATPFIVMNHKIADWPNPYGNTGDQCLVAFACADGSTADDWIISQRMTATEESSFEFYGRCYESAASVMGFAQGNALVMVSTADDPTDLSRYEQVAQYQLERPSADEYQPYMTDLSSYSGQDIYVALRHQVSGEGLCDMFDDFSFNHFSSFSGVEALPSDGKGISVYYDPASETLRADGAGDAEFTVVSMSGSVVSQTCGSEIGVSSLAAGVYLVKVVSPEGTIVSRFVKK